VSHYKVRALNKLYSYLVLPL